MVGLVTEAKTPLFLPVPSAMLVGVSADAQASLGPMLGSLAVLKVGHIAGACERMLATWPLVLIVGGRNKEADLQTLRATALDISADVIVLADYPDPAKLHEAILAGVKKASRLR
jgi:hypothetical protein